MMGGSVGIGTTTPGTLLDVSGGSIRTDSQLISTVTTGTAPLSVTSTTLVANLNVDSLDSLDSTDFLRSNADDTYEGGSTLTFTGSADFNGDLTITDQVVVLDAATYSTLDLTGDLRVMATGDDDDYIYFNTATNAAALLWEGYSATNDPGFRVNTSTNEIEYRDEDAAGWTTLDSMSSTDRAKYDIVVDVDGGGDYTNLQTAIDNASAGDSIFIAPGTYTNSGNFAVDLELKLFGAGAGATIISGATGAATITVNVDVDNVEIHDMEITNSGSANTDHGIYLEQWNGSDNTVLNNLEISGGYEGIRNEGGDQVTITNNYIHDVNYGAIYIWEAPNSIIEGNIINNTEWDAIVVNQTSDYTVVSNNTVTDWLSTRYCIDTYSNTHVSIIGNTCNGTANSLGGIYINQAQDTAVSGNTIDDATGDGILLANSANSNRTTITGNVITDNGGDGIDLGGSSVYDITVVGNTILGNSGSAINNNTGNGNKVYANNTSATSETFSILNTSSDTTLTINNPDGSNVANLTLEGDLTVSGGDMIGGGGAQIDLGEAVSGDIQIYANDTDDYIYFNTATNAAAIFWEGYGATNDPGIRVNTSTNRLEYRDEDVAGWVTFDSLAGGASFWTDEGTALTPAGDEDIRLEDGDWIGVGSGANQPYLTFDDTGDYFEMMGGSVGIGTTAPGALLDVSGGSIRTDSQLISTVTTGTAPLSVTSTTLVANLNVDSLDSLDSTDFLRSNADDTYEGGSTLTFTGSADFNGDLTITDQVVVLDAATYSALDLTGDLRVMATGDDDDYIYFNTATDSAAIFWEGYGATNDPGIRVNTSTNRLEYRDEDVAGWTTLDSLAGGFWTDGGTYLTPTGGEDVQLGDGDWIGVGSGANQPYLTFDDTSDYFEFMGGNVGIGLTNPGGTLDVLDATSAQLRLSHTASSVYGEFQVDGSGNLIVTTTGSSVTLSGDALSTGGNITSGGDLTISGDDIYDSGSNQIFSFDGSGGIDSIADLTGAGRRSKTIMISPEYAGGTLTAFYGSGTDSSTTGSMIADAEPAADVLRTYYDWKSTESTLNYYTVAVRIRLPQDFDAWEGTDALQIDINTESTSSANNLVSIYVYNSDDTPGTAVTTSTANTSDTGDVWKTISIDDSALITGGAPYWDAAGEKGVIYLRMGSKDDTADGYFARIGDIKLNYLSKW
jgi:parallel beta-helix repeat protein